MKIFSLVLTLLLALLDPPARAQSPDLPTFSVSSGQVTEASVQISADGPRLGMNLVAAKRAEFSDFTRDNLGKKIRFVVADRLVQEPFIRAQILSGSIDVVVASPEEGLALAKVLMAK